VFLLVFTVAQGSTTDELEGIPAFHAVHNETDLEGFGHAHALVFGGSEESDQRIQVEENPSRHRYDRDKG